MRDLKNISRVYGTKRAIEVHSTGNYVKDGNAHLKTGPIAPRGRNLKHTIFDPYLVLLTDTGREIAYRRFARQYNANYPSGKNVVHINFRKKKRISKWKNWLPKNWRFREETEPVYTPA